MKKLSLAAFVAAALFLAGTAHAEDPFTRGRAQAGAQLHYGFFMGEGDPNPYGLGLGANGGYTFDSSLFVGGRFDYFFGGDEDTPTGEVSANFFQLMGVLGYDVGASERLVLRPQLGLGWVWTHGEVCSGGTCQDLDTDSEFTIAPGVRALYSLDPLHLSAEVSYNNVFSERNVDSLFFGIGAGWTF